MVLVCISLSGNLELSLKAAAASIKIVVFGAEPNQHTIALIGGAKCVLAADCFSFPVPHRHARRGQKEKADITRLRAKRAYRRGHD